MELPDEAKYSPKGVVPIQVAGNDRTRALVIPCTRRRGGRTTTTTEQDVPATGEDLEPNPRPEGPGQGERSRPAAERSHSERPAGGGGITPSDTSATEEADKEEADALAKQEDRAEEGDQPLHRFLLEWDLSPLDKRLRRHSERENSLATEAPAGESPPGAGTLADEHAEGATTSTGTAGPDKDTAPETVAAKNTEPPTASHCSQDPDRLRNSLARSCNEGLG